MKLKNHFSLALILLLLPLSLWAKATAKIQGLMIQAEEMTRDNQTQVIALKGGIQIVYKDRHIEAEMATINLKSKTIEAQGHVQMVDAKSTIQGDRIVFDFEDGSGLIYNGMVQSGSITFEGSVLQKLGPDEYYVLDSNYTACTNCPATWSFSGTSIRADLGGYAYIKNSVFKIASVPIFWLPYLVVPLKSDRQSGFLTPSFSGSEKGGFAASESFFWAISKSSDATLTAKNYDLRGFKPLLNYRYLLNKSSYGELDAAFITDRVFRSEERYLNYQKLEDRERSTNRWFTKYEHFYELPEGFIQRTQLNIASDIQYSKDFEEETKNYGDPAMENRISLSKNSEFSHFHIDSSYYLNMLHSNPMAGNDDAIHRFPELQFTLVPQKLENSDLLYSLDIDFTNFTRSGNGYDDLSKKLDSNGKLIRYRKNSCSDPTYENNPNCLVQNDGKYTPYEDLIRTGQRLDFKPSIYSPFKLGQFIDVLPRLTYRETHYNFDTQEERSNVRRLLKGEIGAKTHISRIYGDMESLKGTRIKHDIQPEISYSVTPWIDHKSHPFFGFTQQTEVPAYTQNSISDGDLASDFGLQFDYNDRIYDRNILTYAITNKWIEKSWIEDVPNYLQFATFKISQSYDLYEAAKDKDNRQPWSDMSALLNLRFKNFSTTSTLNYYTYQKVTDSTSTLRFWDDMGRFIQVGFSRKYQITRGLTSVDVGARTEDYVLDSGFISKYVNLINRFIIDGNPPPTKQDKKLKSWAYIAQIKPPGECWSIRIMNYLPVDGEAKINFDFQFPFDGKRIPNTPAKEIETLSF